MEFKWLETLCDKVTPQYVEKSQCKEPIGEDETVIGHFTENQKKLWGILEYLKEENNRVQDEDFDESLAETLTKAEYEKQKVLFQQTRSKQLNLLDRQLKAVSKLFWADIASVQGESLDVAAWDRAKGFGLRDNWQVVATSPATSDKCPSCGKSDCGGAHVLGALMDSPLGMVLALSMLTE